MKIAILGTYPPRKCGIARFTNDLYKSLNSIHPMQVNIIALSNLAEGTFAPEVKQVIEKDNLDSYIKAAEFVNDNYDICIVQHEYGIFGGHSGHYLVEFLKNIHICTITNLHTILKQPTIAERTIIQQLAMHSDKITVMSNTAREILGMEYALFDTKVMLIPHGVPRFSSNKNDIKKALGLNKKKVILSFGFMAPNKGYETVIEAVEKLKELNFVYIILGETHPEVLKNQGQQYRESLEQKVIDLDLGEKVIFINEFVNDGLLAKYLKACDIFVSAHRDENQISSGALTFALGAGAAVISTPYWYALDLLAEDRGLLFNFGDSLGLSELLNILLKNEDILKLYSNNASRYTENMQWDKIGHKINNLIDAVILSSSTRKDLLGYFPSRKEIST